MPRDLKQALGFLIGFAIVLWLGPMVVNIARSEVPDADLRALEAELFAQVNAVRDDYHRVPLERRTALDEVALAHSRDMAERGFFAHDNPDGQNPLQRLQKGQLQGFSLAAENIGKTTARAPSREIVNGWLYSRDHRRNLLAPPFNATGIGVVRAPDGSLLFTQVYVALPR